MRGLDEYERAVLSAIGGHYPNRWPGKEDGQALHRLLCRRIVVVGPMCAKFGMHPDLIITPLGRDVSEWDRMAREGTILS